MCSCQSERLTASRCSFSSYVFLLPVSLQSVKIFSRWTFQVPHWWRARPVLSHLSPGNNTPLHPPGQRSGQSANQDARQEQEAERTPQIKRRSLTADGQLPVLILTLHCRLSLWLLLHRLFLKKIQLFLVLGLQVFLFSWNHLHW